MLAIGLLALEVYRKDTAYIILLVIGLVAWLVFRIWMGLPGIYFAKLNEAIDWHRWTEVLELVEKSARIRRHHIVKIPLAALARSRAKALAGLGRLSEGLDELKRFENRPEMPGWLYKTHVAGLYHVVRQHDLALEYYMQAIEEKPTPTLYSDFADSLLRYKKDTVRARAALEEAGKGPTSETSKPYAMRNRGILAYLEGNYALARQELEAGLKVVEGRHQPFKDRYLNITKAYLCCVLARQGEMAEARRLLAQVREYLCATSQEELFEECNKLTDVS